MSESNDKQELWKKRKTYPMRFIKMIVNVILILPVILYAAGYNAIKENEWCWEAF